MDLSAAVTLISPVKEKRIVEQVTAPPPPKIAVPPQRISDDKIKDYLLKIRQPDVPHGDDIRLGEAEKKILDSVVSRLQRLNDHLGYGHFGVIGFDDAIRYARDHSSVGAFSREELDFLEMIYCRDASDYGFFGAKQVVGLTQSIDHTEIYKVPYSGNYLFRGASLEKYEEIKRDLGDECLLTSGIRGLIKQFYLYLNKANLHDGNLSLASRSLAPPGYSYHATGDFDIGQMGFGKFNFSEKFTQTHVFQKLAAQGYVEYRYKRDNMLGVRYEPWHVKL